MNSLRTQTTLRLRIGLPVNYDELLKEERLGEVFLTFH